MESYVFLLGLCVIQSVFNLQEPVLKRDVIIQKDIISSLPNQFSKLIGGGTQTGAKYEVLGCILELAKDGCKYTFLAKESTCKDKLSVSRLFEYFFKTEKLKTLSKDMMPFNIMDIERFVVDCDGEVDFEATAKESFDIIKRMLRVDNGKVNFNFNYKEINRSMSIKNFAIELTGEITIDDKVVPIAFTKPKTSTDAKFSLKVSSINIANFASVFSKKPLYDDKTPEQAKLFANTIINEPSINGILSVDESFEIILRGVVSEIVELGEFVLYLVVHKPTDSAPAVAIVAELNSQPTKILSTLTGKDLSNIPIISNILLNVVIEFASKNVTVLKDAKINRILAKYAINGKRILQGTKIKLELPSKSIIQNLETSLKHLPETIYFLLYIFDNHIAFRFLQDAPIDLANIMSTFIKKVPEVLFTKIYKVSPNIEVMQFDINIETKAIELKAVAKEDVILGEDLISLEKPKFEIKTKVDGSWSFEMTATKKMAEKSMLVSLQKKGPLFVFNGKIDTFTMKQVAENFGAQETAKEIISRFQFLDFDVKDVEATAVFNSGLLELHIRANPVFFTYDDTQFEGYIFDTSEGRKMAFTLVIHKLSVNELIEQIFGKKISQVHWMNDLTASLTISNMESTKDFNFTIFPSQLRKGIFLSTVVTIPEDCKGEQLCDIAKDKMSVGTKLFMDGQITTDGLTMKGKYMGYGLHFGKNFILKDTFLVIKINKSSAEFSIDGKLTLSNPKLDFEGKVFVGKTGKADLSLTMNSPWKKPFGMKYLTFNNVVMTMGVQPGVPLTKLGLTAELLLGKIGSGEEISTRSIINFNPINVLETFFYGEVSSISLRKIIKAFQWKLELPKVLKDTRFPDGLLIGFTLNPKGVKISHLKSELKIGLTLTGAIEIFSIRSRCEVIITEKLIKIVVDMMPLILSNGLLTMKRSEIDKENGPQLFVMISPESIDVQIQSYVELLGIGKDVLIDISDNGLMFNLHGYMFNLFETNMTVMAPYGHGDIKNAVYVITSCLSSNLNDITLESADTITNGGAETARALRENQENLHESTLWFKKSIIKVHNWKTKLKKRLSALQIKSDNLDLIDNYLAATCNAKCDSVCIGGPSTLQKCKQILKVWVTCPKWNKCKRLVKDTLCIAKCNAKKVLLEKNALKKRNKMEILLDSITRIKKALSYAEELVDKSKHLMKSTKRASMEIEKAASAGRQAMYAVAKFTKKHLILIHDICFNTTLEQAEQGCFDLNIDVKIGDVKRVKLETPVCMDGNYVKNIARSIAEQLFPGLTSIKERIAKARQYIYEVRKIKENLENYVKETEFKEHEIEHDEKVDFSNDEDEDNHLDKEVIQSKKNESKISHMVSDKKVTTNMDKRFSALQSTPNEKYIFHQLYSCSPRVVVRDDVTLEVFESDSAWAFSQDDSPFTQILEEDHDSTVYSNNHSSKEDVPPLDTDMLEDQDDPNKCSQTKGLISNYAVVSDAVSLLLSKLKEEKKQFSSEAKKILFRTKLAEEEIISNCVRENISLKRQEDAMFYIYKVKNGTAKWIKDVQHQIEIQDKESLRMWRRSFSDIIKNNKGMDLQRFLDTLKMATEAAKKRHSIPTAANDNVVPNLKSASKIVADLLAGEEASLSLKRSAIKKLHNSVAILKKRIPCAT
ncbi:uncharacterized protein LOC101234357 isoform X1 [Hydra vulgaris]|uniref:uncharacterized protein LOC101234357 isoform X1 n=1 Tax=Hydra vulgaris TaxID=6087 RepID=UPI001F5F7574|nr:uncharacterized protein LOC101234357 [Hydra vulgaris]